MSIGVIAISEAPVAAARMPATSSSGRGAGPPPRRILRATPDVVTAPEPR